MYALEKWVLNSSVKRVQAPGEGISLIPNFITVKRFYHMNILRGYQLNDTLRLFITLFLPNKLKLKKKSTLISKENPGGPGPQESTVYN